MNVLRTCRALVIDDEEEEAIPIIRAVGKLGIGCIYVPGDRQEDLPRPPLEGIRLVFLDMQLGTSGNPRQVGTQTAKVVSAVVSPRQAPVLIVLWTKHPEYIEEFKRALFGLDAAYRTGLIITSMEKPARSEDIDPQQVFEEVLRCLERHFPLKVIWRWEQLCHDAASESTAALAHIVADNAGLHENESDEARTTRWLDAMVHVLRTLITASAGQHLSESTALADLMLAFAALHQDRLENGAITEDDMELGPILSEKPSQCSDEEAAALNTMFLTARVKEGDASVRHGNLYVPQQEAGEGCPHCRCRTSASDLARELLCLTKDPEYEKLSSRYNNLARKAGAEADIGVLRTRLEACISKIVEQCRPVLLEVTPSCDYAQRNCQVARFIGGLLVPSRLKKWVNRKDCVRVVGPFHLPRTQDAHLLVLSSRFPYTIPDAPSVVTASPLCRIRTPVLLDIQNWFAFQGARPGYMSAPS